MAQNEEMVETLKALGLTYVQAKIYSTLNQTGEATVETIAKNTQTARQQLYEPLSKLEKISLVQKIISNPPKYNALPITKALTILMNNKNKETQELQDKTNKLLKKLKENQTTQQPQLEKMRTTILSGLEAYSYEIDKASIKAHASFDGTTTVEGFRHGMFKAGEIHREAIKRGVCYRHIISKPVDKQIILGDEDLRENPLWQVRISPSPLSFFIIIVDNKEVFISSDGEKKDLINYHSNCTSFITLAQNYYNTLWNNSIEIRTLT